MGAEDIRKLGQAILDYLGWPDPNGDFRQRQLRDRHGHSYSNSNRTEDTYKWQRL
jgi:hypothetical protein